jgi:hypothetical protein
MPGILKGLGTAGMVVAVMAVIDDVAAAAFAATITATNRESSEAANAAVRFSASYPPQFGK